MAGAGVERSAAWRRVAKPMPDHHRKANAERSKVLSAIEHVFSTQKYRIRLFARTIRIARVAPKSGMLNPAYKPSRLA
jgi:hypothetical protein